MKAFTNACCDPLYRLQGARVAATEEFDLGERFFHIQPEIDKLCRR
jgi:hypothetical protein